MNFAVLILGNISLKVKWLLLERKNSWSTGPENSSNIDCATLRLSGLIFFLFISKNSTATGAYKDWQIRQADQAVRLYFSNFLISISPKILHGATSTVNNLTPQKTALQNFQEALRLRNYALRTERTYLHWVVQYFSFCKTRNPSLSEKSPCTVDLVRDFLAYLVMTKNVSASTQNLAFNSILMFFRLVFNQDLGNLKNTVRARTGQKLPVVLSVDETKKLLTSVKGTTGLMLKIIYGGGLRVNECCSLRIKDIDFDQSLITIRDGKGGKDRTTLLPASLLPPPNRSIPHLCLDSLTKL